MELHSPIGDIQAERCALWHMVNGERILIHQISGSDFSDTTAKGIFEAFQKTEVNLLETENILKTNYVWLEWITKAHYLGAPYQVIEQMKRKRAQREAEAFRVSGEPEAYPDQLRAKGDDISKLFVSKRITMDDMADRIQNTPPKVPTGFPLMDYLCKGGIEEGGVFVIAARPGVGKTAMAVNIAKHILEKEKTVYFGSLEMSEEKILMRLAQTFWSSTEEEVKKNIHDMKKMPGSIIIDNPGYDLSKVISNMSLHLDADVFFLDYYQLIRLEGRESHIQKLEIISNRLKEFAFTHKKPLVVLAQLNRMIETDRSNREPVLADLRGCGALEQDASVVTFLWDKSAKDEAAKSVGSIASSLAGEKETNADLKWVVKKNRNGMLGTIDLTFKPETMTFSHS